MGKVTVKHFINTNLKPYTVRGQKYYAVYLLITVNRKTTKVRSHAFEEMHTEKEFESFLKRGSDFYKAILDETRTVENIILTQLEFDPEFDTTLFSALYNLMPKYLIAESQPFARVIIINPNFKNLSLSDLVRNKRTKDRSTNQSSITFFDWYSPSSQLRLIKLMEGRKIRMPIIKLNLSLMYSFFGYLRIIVTANKKYNDIGIRFDMILREFDTRSAQALES
jgi:hypothetical protein